MKIMTNYFDFSSSALITFFYTINSINVSDTGMEISPHNIVKVSSPGKINPRKICQSLYLRK